MHYKILNNGVKMPVLGLGTYLSKDPEVCRDITAEALRIGYRLIDTAQFYGNEEAVAAGIAASGIPREEIFITTKVWFQRYRDAYASVLESMERLRTDYLDLVLLHWPFSDTFKAWRDLERLYREGRVRAIGVSNYGAARLVDHIMCNEVVPAVNQIETNLVCQQKECRLWMDKYEVAHQSYAPFGRGRIDGLYDNDVFRKATARYGKTPQQIVLRFLIQKGVMVIPKTVHADRLAENFDVFDFELDKDEIAGLEALDQAKPLIGRPDDPERVESAFTW